MALKKDFEIQRTGFEGTLIARNAYWKVTKLTGNKEQMIVEVTVFCNDVGVDKKAEFFTPSLTGVNFIAQAYEYLKTLPEFAGAVDC